MDMSQCPVRLPGCKSDVDLQSLLEIELVVCNPNRPPDRVVVTRVYERLSSVLIHVISLQPEYHLLDRCEPGIASRDEKKQLRCCGPEGYTSMGVEGTLRFSQGHCEDGSYFTFSELLTIAESLRTEIEKFLGYGILANIVLHSVSSEV